MAIYLWLKALVAGGLMMTCLAGDHRPSNVSFVCQNLANGSSGEVTLMSDLGFEALRTKNWAWTAWQTPACIVQPPTAAALQDIIPILVQQKIKFAVRSGGHAPHAGAANIDGGVLIDMARFNQIEYNSSAGVVIVGSGLRWGEVYPRLDQYQVTVVGGRVPHVGVGGLTLGGGLSWLSDLYGTAADNVVNYEVILANGSLVNANIGENTDLFWALKGGGNNFGIVTRFTLKAYSGLNNVWGSLRSYTIDHLPALMSALYEYQSVPNKDPYANLEILASASNATTGIIVTLIYLKPVEKPEVFKRFLELNATADITGLQTLTEFIAGYFIPNMTTRFDWATTSLTPKKPLYQQLANLMVQTDAVSQIQSVTAGYLSTSFQPILSSLVKAGRISKGGNALGLQPVNQLWTQVEAEWWFSKDDPTVHKALK